MIPLNADCSQQMERAAVQASKVAGASQDAGGKQQRFCGPSHSALSKGCIMQSGLGARR